MSDSWAPIDVRGWRMLNLWRQPDGERCVRPGMRQIFAPPAGTILVGGFSIRNDFIDEVWHYVVTQNTTTGAIRVLVLDEQFDTFQDFAWASGGTVPIVTAAQVEGLGLIAAPGLPTLFFVLGSSLGFATPVASDNGLTSAIDIPSGIVCVFCNRVVLAEAYGRGLYFSDPIADDGGDPRTFVIENKSSRPGIIYGLHEGADGMLVVTTSEGVYGLDADASVGPSGLVNANIPWRLLSHLPAAAYGSSCVHRGRVFGLTKDGFAPCDGAASTEVFLSDPTLPRARGPAIQAEDWRSARMFTCDEGPAVASADEGALFRTDLQRDVSSWWRDWTDHPGDVRGMLFEHVRGDLFIMPDGVFKATGDFDGVIPLANAADETQPAGTIFGTIDVSADEGHLPRKLSFAAAVDGDRKIYAAVRGSEPPGLVPQADPFGLTIDVTLWGAARKRYLTTPLGAAEFDFGDLYDTPYTRDVGIELTAEGAGARISLIPSISEAVQRRAQKK